MSEKMTKERKTELKKKLVELRKRRHQLKVDLKGTSGAKRDAMKKERSETRDEIVALKAELGIKTKAPKEAKAPKAAKVAKPAAKGKKPAAKAKAKASEEKLVPAAATA